MQGRNGAISVIALAERGALFDPGPCMYMEKLAGQLLSPSSSYRQICYPPQSLHLCGTGTIGLHLTYRDLTASGRPRPT